jgi:hypothetical protein
MPTVADVVLQGVELGMVVLVTQAGLALVWRVFAKFLGL